MSGMLRILRRAGAAGLAALLVLSAAAAASTGWTIVPSPNVNAYFGAPYDELNAVSARSTTDVWAVGEYLDGQRREWQTLALHWDGRGWGIVASPSRKGGYSFLNGGAAVSASEAWVVGRFQSFKDYSASGTLIERWNGKSWRIVASPNATTQGDSLKAAAAVAANDVWAVGAAGGKPLAEHWDGSSWSIVPTPSALDASALNGVAALSASDAWAVGSAYDGSALRTLIERWDGARWTIVPSPNASAGSNVLDAVTAVSANDVWAVGSFFAASGDTETLVEHWNGTSWAIVASPNPASATSSVLAAVAAVSANDLWAVGDLNAGQYSGSTLSERWDGSAWAVVPSPNPGVSVSVLRGVAALPSGDVWAVGRYGSASDSKTLVLHASG